MRNTFKIGPKMTQNLSKYHKMGQNWPKLTKSGPKPRFCLFWVYNGPRQVPIQNALNLAPVPDRFCKIPQKWSKLTKSVKIDQNWSLGQLSKSGPKWWFWDLVGISISNTNIPYPVANSGAFVREMTKTSSWYCIWYWPKPVKTGILTKWPKSTKWPKLSKMTKIDQNMT